MWPRGANGKLGGCVALQRESSCKVGARGDGHLRGDRLHEERRPVGADEQPVHVMARTHVIRIRGGGGGLSHGFESLCGYWKRVRHELATDWNEGQYGAQSLIDADECESSASSRNSIPITENA